MTSNCNTVLLSKLVCSKCSHHLSVFPIYLSRNQEKICGRCHVPEDDWSHIRNEIYEEVVQNISFPCRYETEGCSECRVPAAMPDHENIHCQYRTIHCVTASFSKCTWQGHFGDLIQHCVSDHSSLIGEVSSMDFKDSFERRHILQHNDDYFLIKLGYNVHTNVLTATCTCFEGISVPKYSCKMVLTNGSVSTSMSLVIGNVFEGQSSQITLDHVKSTGTVDGTIEIVEIRLAGKQSRKELLGAMRCPVCLDYMTGWIYQCKVGHSLCEYCEPDVGSSCPTCRSSFGSDPIRNFSLETVASLLVFPCKNSETAGCNFISEGSLLRDHEEFCLFGVHKCPLECGWNNSWKSLPQHIKNSHSDILLVKNSKCVRIDDDIDYFGEKHVDRNFLMISRTLFFLVKFYCDEEHILWEIQLLGPTEEVRNYNFEVQVRSDKSDALLGLMRTTCCSFESGVSKPDRQLASLSVDSVKYFISDYFTYRIDLIN